MNFKAILFDLDDTIHNRNKSLHKFIDLFRGRFFPGMNPEKYSGFKDAFIEIDCRGYKPREEMFEELQKRLFGGLKVNVTECIDYWNKQFPVCAEPMENLYNILGYFLEKNIGTGIVTNGDSHFQNEKIEKLDLKKYMKTVIISDEVGVRKPDPEIFKLALSGLGTHPEETLFVGDNPSRDIKGAMDAGLKSAWLSHSTAWNEESYKPDFIIYNLSELIIIS